MLTITAGLIGDNAHLLRQQNYVIVQHIKSDTVEFVRRLKSIGCRVSRVVGINYSVDRAALESLLDDDIAAEVKEFSQISGYLNEVLIRGDDPITLLDVGGYGAEIAAADNSSETIRFIVEDTNNGLWRYQSAHLHCPIMDVASIENKSVENAFIGGRIVDAVFEYFAKSRIAAPTQGFVVVGYGGIGENVCSALAVRSINAAVIELDERKLAIAGARGHRVARSIVGLQDANVIIGCTGTPSISLKELKAIGCRPFLISGSSKTIEFEDILMNGILSPLCSSNAVIEEGTGATIVNNGHPINFHYGSLNNEISDFMFANITAAIIEGSDKRGGSIFRLSDKWQRSVCRLWSNHYIA